MCEPLFETRYLKQRTMAVPVPSQGLSVRWKEFICGGGAAFCNIMISYPLNKLIFRQVRLLIIFLFIW